MIMTSAAEFNIIGHTLQLVCARLAVFNIAVCLNLSEERLVTIRA